MPKEIIIIPGCTDLNRGDQALVWESADLMREVVPDASYCVLESGINKGDIFLQSRQTHQLGFSIIPKILKHPSRITQNSKKKSVGYSKTDYILWGLQSVYDLFYTSLILSRFSIFNKLGEAFLSGDQKQTIDRFRNAHTIVVKGGGFIHSYGRATDFYTMYFSLYHVLLGIRFKKNILIFPNSIGPIKGYFTRKLVNYIFSKCKLITVREKVSQEYLKDSFALQTELFPDLGFYLQPKPIDYADYYHQRNIPLGGKKLVGITLRPYRFPNSRDPEQRYREYISEIIDFVKIATANGYHIVFFAHTLGPSSHEDDRLAIADVMKSLPQEMTPDYSYVEDFELDCKDIMGLYSHLDFMVGTRFHSVIFALNVNVPCVAIAYGGNKSFGIMTDMQLAEYVYPIEKFKGAKLYELLENATSGTEDYLSKIKTYRVYLETARAALIGRIISIVR
jgi:colanic acid/amylovoran biosynthesis protein WcaK/AmsJ